LLGVGAANLAAGLSSGMVVNGSLSKTAVNGSAGARTQLSGLTVAGLTIVTLLFLTGLFEDLPEATLAAVVIAAVIELVDIHALIRLYRIFTGPPSRFGLAIRPDFVAAIAAMLGVLVFDTLPGLFIGIAVSLLLLIYRASAPHVAELGAVPDTPGHYTDLARHDDNERVPGVVIVRPESGLFFANADHVRNEIRAHVSSARPHTVVLDAENGAVRRRDCDHDARATRGRSGARQRAARDRARPRCSTGRSRARRRAGQPACLPDRPGRGRRDGRAGGLRLLSCRRRPFPSRP
jgi:MFS superfamily sulfate permease-like transporter